MKKSIPYLLICILVSISILFTGCTSNLPTNDKVQMATTVQPDQAAASSTLPESENYIMSIDVNPSIELTVANGLVTEVFAYNDDGEQLLLAIDVIGQSPQQAVQAIIAELAEAGYLGDKELSPQLIVTVANDQKVSEETIEAIKDSAEQAIEKQGVDCKVNTAFVSDEIADEAKDAGLSVGRFMLYSSISASEGLSLEDVIITYGDLKIGELMDMFDDAKDVFKAYNKEAERNEDLDGLTPEQIAMIEPALDAFHAEMKAAKAAFQQAFADIKDDVKQEMTALKADYKHVDKEGYVEQAGLIRKAMLSARRDAITAMKVAIETAKDNFFAAVAAMNLPEDILARLIDKEAGEAVEPESDNLDGLLNSLVQEPEDEDEDKGEDEDEDCKPAARENQGRANGKDADQDLDDDDED